MPRRRVHVGTSGWTYDDWTGPFYPEAVKGADRLPFYARTFDTVELNASFYRVPSDAAIDAWNRRVPKRFHFVAKGSRLVTHRKKLADCAEPLAFFLRRILRLATLRVILWQLPPSLRRDPERLANFLKALPGNVRHAFEFRHESWWDEEVRDVLASRDAAFVAVSHPRLPEDVVVTGDLLYARFHGKGRLYDYDYSDAELRAWVGRLRPHLPGRTLYAFFNNDWHANAPRNALAFRRLLGSGG